MQYERSVFMLMNLERIINQLCIFPQLYGAFYCLSATSFGFMARNFTGLVPFHRFHFLAQQATVFS